MCCLGLLLLAGCFETEQEFTLNPDGSGKVVHRCKFQNVDFSGGKRSTEAQAKVAVAEFLKKAKGVEAWRDVRYSVLEDGRIAFEGTAYFRKLDELDLPNQTMMEFNWTTTPDGNGVLALRTDANKKDKPKAADPAAFSADERAKRIKDGRAQYQQAKPMMAAIVAGMKHDVIVHLPGKPAGDSAFQASSDTVSLHFDGAKLLAAMDSLINDDAWMLKNAGNLKGEGGPPMDDAVSELLFGRKGPVEARVTGLKKPAFDFETEVAEAKTQWPEVEKSLGLGPLPVAAPAKSGEIKSVKVVGVRLVKELDEQWGLSPLGSTPGLTLALLAELPGSVHAMTEECILVGAVADNGADLLPESEYKRHFSFPKLSEDKTRVLLEAELTPPPAGVTRLKELSGRVQYTVAGGVVETELGFKKLAAKEAGKAFGATITSIGDKSEDGSQEMELHLDLEPDQIKAVLLVVGKERSELNRHGYNGGGGSFEYTFQAEKGFPPKARLVIETYGEFQTYDAPFTLQDVPLFELASDVGAP